MRYLLICLVLPLISFAQPRENRELPIFESIPYFTVGDSIVGWSLSADGQWVSRPNTIPVIGISRNEEFYNRKDNALGIDNIKRLMAYKVKYGKDTLICLLKIASDGKYRYPNRRKGWDNYYSGYYWLVRYRDLRNALEYFEEKDTSDAIVLRIKAWEGRLIKEIDDIEDQEEILEEIVSSTIVKPDFDRNLVLTLQEGSNSSTLRFHLVSMHVIFNDIEGVRKNFTKRGRSVYGSVRLFDFMYYEMDRKNFYDILNLDANLDRLLEEEMDPVFDAGKSDVDAIMDSSATALDSLDIDW